MNRMTALAGMSLVTLGLLIVPARGGDKGLDNPYYPLKVGTTWEYSSTAAGGKKTTVKVTAHEKILDMMCAKLETDQGGAPLQIEYLTVKEDGVYRVQIGADPIKPPFLILKAPLTKGDEWAVDSAAKGFAVKGKLSVGGEEKVTAGKTDYQAVPVKSADLKLGGQNAEMETWFAKGKGMVKQRFELPGAKLKVELLLEQFTDGK